MKKTHTQKTHRKSQSWVNMQREWCMRTKRLILTVNIDTFDYLNMYATLKVSLKWMGWRETNRETPEYIKRYTCSGNTDKNPNVYLINWSDECTWIEVETERLYAALKSRMYRDIDSRFFFHKNQSEEKNFISWFDVNCANVSLSLCTTNTCHLKWPACFVSALDASMIFLQMTYF